MLKQKATRKPGVPDELWIAYENAWTRFSRTPTGDIRIGIARQMVDTFEDMMNKWKPKAVGVQDIFDYHAEKDRTTAPYRSITQVSD